MAKQKFETTLESSDRGAVRLFMPFDPSATWGKKPRHFVKGSINGSPFEGSLGVRGGEYFFPVSKELRALAKVAAGDTVKVVVEPAEAAVDALPEDLARALAKNEKARVFFDGLSAFYRNGYVGWITSAKKSETRTERLTKTIELLAAGKKQR